MDQYLAHVSNINDLKNELSNKKSITTNPELLRNLLEIVKDRAGNVIIGESNSGNHSFSAYKAFKGHKKALIYS